jgi:small subunit ribosomal protein S13
MVFLFGANLPDHKLASIALRNVFGIGPNKAQQLCHRLALHPQCRMRDLSEPQLSTLAKEIVAQGPIGHERTLPKCTYFMSKVQREIGKRVQHLHQIKCWRGDRLARGLPAHNQRTTTNANTASCVTLYEIRLDIDDRKRLGVFVRLRPHETTPQQTPTFRKQA